MSDAGTSPWEQLNETGRLLFLQGDLGRAAQAFGAAIAAAEQDGDPLRQSSSLGNLAQLRYQQRELSEAESLFKRAIALREQALGPDHASVSQPLNNLAALHVARGELAQAQPLLARALAILERHRSPSHPDVAVTLNNLAKLHVRRGDHAAAEPLLLRLLAAKRALGEDHPDVATVLASVATLRLAAGRPADAEAAWQEALAIRERALKPTDPALAQALEGLADARAALGRPADALALRERALSIREAALGGDHASVTGARARIAALRSASTPASPAAGALGTSQVPAAASPGGAAPPPRLSALRMTALEDENVPRVAGGVPDEPTRLAVPETSPMNAWLLESEPPPHIIDGGGVLASPRWSPPFTPAVPRASGAAPRPAPLQNSQLRPSEEHPSAPSPSAPARDAPGWWSASAAPGSPAAPAPRPEPRSEPLSFGALRAPGRASGSVAAPASSSSGSPAASDRSSAPVARGPLAAPESWRRDERRSEPRRASADRLTGNEITVPRDARHYGAHSRRAASRSRWPVAIAIVAALLLAAGLWLALGRSASEYGASRAGAGTQSAGVGEESIAVPAPRSPAAAPTQAADPALATRLPEFSLDSGPRRVGRASGSPSVGDVIVPGLAVERVVRAIDDSARGKVDRSVKLQIEPPSLREP